MSEGELRVEATGETVGEAKWTAIRELERRHPGLDREAVDFQVLSEGERGLMGIGREPARVLATLTSLPAAGGATPPAPPPAAPPRPEPPERPRRERRPPSPAVSAGPASARPEAVRATEVLEAIAAGLGVGATVHVTDEGEGLLATLGGEDLGLLIGKHGKTIDAIQYLVNAIVAGDAGEDRVPVTVDAQNYRRRREVALHETAERAALDVVRHGQEVTLEPMTSVERKIVHLYLKDHPEVETGSDGREPYRHVVVRPRTS
jgi:spoIIIJ-associated protein